MERLKEIWRRLSYYLKRESFDQSLAEEMRHHLELKIEENIKNGLDPVAARQSALREFGNRTLLQEKSRTVWGFKIMDTLVQDLGYGLRILRRNPGFTLVAVLSLALGIGANSAIFSLVNAIFLRQLPVPNPDQLVLLHRVTQQSGADESFSYPVYRQLVQRELPFTGVFAEHNGMNLTNIIYKTSGGDGSSEHAMVNFVSGDFFSVMGVDAAAGRTFTASDDVRLGEHPVAVISYRYWQRRFGCDTRAIGKVFTLNGTQFTIIGVTPKDFKGVFIEISPDFWLPMMMRGVVSPSFSLSGDPAENWISIWGRLQPGVTKQQAEAQVSAIFKEVLPTMDTSKMEEEQRVQFLGQEIDLISGSRGSTDLRDDLFVPLIIIAVIVCLVLVIACVNVANLLLGRAAARHREIAVRLSLGASSLRIIRQLMTESVLLAVMGGAVGLLLAYWAGHALTALVSEVYFSSELNLSPDYRVLGFTTGVSVLSSIVFGLVPAFRSSRLDLSTALKGGTASADGRTARHRLGKALVVGQVAISLLVLICAGLFIRTLQNLKTADLGLNTENVLLLKFDNLTRGSEGIKRVYLYQQILDHLESLPGVTSASLSFNTLLMGENNHDSVTVTSDAHKTETDTRTCFDFVSPDYFQTVGMRLAVGRALLRQDDEKAQKVAVINETLAARLFPSENPIGNYIHLREITGDAAIQIVGTVRNAKYDSVREKPKSMVFLSYRQFAPMADQGFEVQVRTTDDPQSHAPAIEREVMTVNRDLWSWDVRSFASQADNALLQDKMMAKLSGLFGALALLLASIGLYGVLSYSVSRRTHAIGIRMAIGAQSGRIAFMVMKETMLLVMIGLVIALGAAFATTRLFSSLLFGISSNDPITLLFAVVLLVVIAMIAGYLPARRAARVDPMIALRSE